MKNIFKRVHKTINCPQCGAKLPIYIEQTKLLQCQYCGSTIFLEDKEARLAGYSSTLTPEPSLIKLAQVFRYKHKFYFPLGKIRYSYGRGFWEEWWLKDNKDQTYWLSIDEGDFALEQEDQEVPYTLKMLKDIEIGQELDNAWIVTEIGKGVCKGFEGSLPWDIKIDEEYRYIQLSDENANLRTIEIEKENIQSFTGRWIDPFDIEVS